MASPVTAIPVPANDGMHILFSLNDNKQLALELRSAESREEYDRYVNHGTSEGVVINPAQISAVMQNGLVTVYGLATSGPKDKTATALSMLSPIYNPISDTANKGQMLETTLKGVAACSDGKSGNWIYHTRLNKNNAVEVVEVQVKSGAGNSEILELERKRADPPSKDSNLAAFWEGHPFIFYTNTDQGSNIYYYNIFHDNLNPINGTDNVKPASPLAVTTIRSQNNEDGVFHYVVLYYATRNLNLGRVVGRLQHGDVSWDDPQSIEDGPPMDDKTMIAVATRETVNYVYYIPEKGTTRAAPGEYVPYVDANENWRKNP